MCCVLMRSQITEDTCSLSMRFADVECLLQDALAKCLTDKTCIQDLICLQGCAGKEDETACQVTHLAKMLEVPQQ